MTNGEWGDWVKNLTAEVERLRAENAGLRSILADVLVYFVMPSGEKKRAIRDRISKMPKPGAGT